MGRAADLLAALSLQEKISLLSGRDTWATVPIPRLGIRSLVMTDGPHGVRSNFEAAGRKSGSATAFPTGVSMASTWNPDLIARAGAALGDETRGMGCDILLGPCVNIVRHPLGGRNFESYSEDPFLAGRIGVAYVNGVQSRGVGASLKHFACNNQETERGRGSSVVDERTLREIYLPAFESVVKDADPWTVMCSYNRLNGVYASEHSCLLRQILKGEWRFPGVVISDWGANHSIVESIEGGLDMEMPGPAKYYALLEEAVRNFQVDETLIDEAAGRILLLIDRSAKAGARTTAGLSSVNSPGHRALTREVAQEAITLLKNDRGALPLLSVKTLAVFGPNAAQMQISGGGSSCVVPPCRIEPLEAIGKLAGKGVKIIYAQGCDNAESRGQSAAIAEAVAIARKSDAAVVFAGMPANYESEGSDRPSMRLPGAQNELIGAVANVNKRTVVVLNCGSPVAMPWIDSVGSLVQMYYPGMEGGSAIARVLFGKVNPSGKLTVTYPRRIQDTPAFINHPGTHEVFYGERIYVGYRYYDTKEIEPLFPFGHGLSYTTFEYSGMEVPESLIGETVSVSFTVKNTGTREGREVAQLYVLDKESSLDRPLKELKGFCKVSLKPGKSCRATLALDRRSFAFYDPYKKMWVVEPGEFEILVGSSSRDIRLTAHIVMREPGKRV